MQTIENNFLLFIASVYDALLQHKNWNKQKGYNFK
jgi:hypothetical protein